jgi:hypothetical protein
MTIDDLIFRPEVITGKTALARMWPTWATPSCMHVGDSIAEAFATALPSEADLELYAQFVESQFPLGVVSENRLAPVLKQALAFTWLLTGECSFPEELFEFSSVTTILGFAPLWLDGSPRFQWSPHLVVN